MFLLGLLLLPGLTGRAWSQDLALGAPTFSSASERDSGHEDHTFPVTLTQAVAGRVDYMLCFSSASAGANHATRNEDFRVIRGGVAQDRRRSCARSFIRAGQTSTATGDLIGIRVWGDTRVEPDEQVDVSLTPLIYTGDSGDSQHDYDYTDRTQMKYNVSMSAADSRRSYTILNDDQPRVTTRRPQQPLYYHLHVVPDSRGEGPLDERTGVPPPRVRPITVTLDRTLDDGSSTIIYYLCFGGTATIDRNNTWDAGEDYRVLKNGVAINFAQGDACTQTAGITAGNSEPNAVNQISIEVRPDEEVEPNETVIITPTVTSGVARGHAGTYTIRNDDFGVTVTEVTIDGTGGAVDEGGFAEFRVKIATPPGGSSVRRINVAARVPWTDEVWSNTMITAGPEAWFQVPTYGVTGDYHLCAWVRPGRDYTIVGTSGNAPSTTGNRVNVNDGKASSCPSGHTVLVRNTVTDFQHGMGSDSLVQDSVAPSSCHDDVKPAVRGYALETHHGTAHVTRWKQVLAAFGDDNGHAAMSLATAKQMRDKYSANRWNPVVDALQCIEDAADETPAPADPVVSVSGGGAVTEGGDAVFTVAASPAPAADLDVTLAVSDDATADFLAAGDEGSRTVTILAGQASATLTLSTVNDATDEPDGSVSAVLQSGTGYAVADPPADAAKVLVSDDDDPAPADPVVSVSGGGAVTEGGDAVFTVAASPAPAANLDVTLAVSDDATADFLAAGDEGSHAVTILAGQASATLTLSTVNDATDEPDGSVSATVQSGTGYAVADAPANAAKVAVSDDDAAASGPTLSVNDVTVKEGPYRQVWFTVTLSEATRLGASFSWRVRESSPVSAKRNLDFGAPSGKSYAYIRPGATRLRIKAAHVVDDSHDEGSETFEIVLSDANGATIADGVGVATIVNSDPMPRDHLGHAGHSLASGVAASVAERANAARPSLGVTPGLDGTSAEVGTEGGWAVWTRATGASFGADGLSGDSRRVTFGADLDRGDGLLLGVMAVTDAAESASRGYMAETDTLAVVPWAAMNGTWAALGAGTGEMSLAHGPETMEAGSEWVFAGAGWTDGSVSGDAFWQRMSSDAADGLAASAGETWRLRLGWAGAFAPTPSLTLSPSLSLFGEGGDIPGEAGLEAGLGLSWTQGSWSLDAHAQRAFTGGDGDAHALSGTLTRSWRNTRMFVSEDTVGAEFRKEF